jgi:hypothetical protein
LGCGRQCCAPGCASLLLNESNNNTPKQTLDQFK